MCTNTLRASNVVAPYCHDFPVRAPSCSWLPQALRISASTGMGCTAGKALFLNPCPLTSITPLTAMTPNSAIIWRVASSGRLYEPCGCSNNVAWPFSSCSRGSYVTSHFWPRIATVRYFVFTTRTSRMAYPWPSPQAQRGHSTSTCHWQTR